VPLNRVRLTAAKSSLGRHRISASPDPRVQTQPRLRKTTNSASPDPRAQTQPRPQKMVFALPDPRARTRPRPRKTDSASLDPRGRTQPRPQGSDSTSAPEDDEHRHARPQGSDSASTPGFGLDLDLGRWTSPRPTLGVGLSLDSRRRTRPRPRRSLHLARPRARTDHVTGGAIITLPLASSGYEEQDRRPIWLSPVNK
jgi:hypothetical protein